MRKATAIYPSLILVGVLLSPLSIDAFAEQNLPAPISQPAERINNRFRAIRLFGVEIGGPEDGFSLADRSKFESAKKMGARSIDLRPIWSALEPHPGVYDWKILDAAMENASAVGLPVTVTLRFFDRQVPEWLVDENMIDQDGRNHFAYSGFQSRSPSYWGPKARSSYLRLIEQLVRRYRKNASVLSWQFFYGYNDSFYLGIWQGEQTIYDYSRYSQVMYRYYLSRVRNYSLSALNRRYGSSYRNWNEVSQPRPVFGELNVSLAWHDFQDYRMWSIERMFDDMYRTVRKLDSRPLILYYDGSLHHSAHQLSVYDVGLRLFRRYGGALDITCFEDPVPAEIGSGIVHYPVLLDANSEVLSRQVIDTLVQYVVGGGKLVLLPRSGRYALEDGRPDYPLLTGLKRPEVHECEDEGVQRWNFGKGSVTR